MKLLDLFCGAGGAARGYELAGFDKIIGIDIQDQPNYPYKCIVYNAMDYIYECNLNSFDLVHASPPCQGYSWSSKRLGRNYPKLINELREILIDRDIPYVIENVLGSTLINPIILEGNMFDLPLKRRRLFECNFDVHQPKIIPQDKKIFVTVAGNGGNALSYSLNHYRLAMGIWWMNKKEITQAIPPKYTEYIGKEFLYSKERGLL